MYHATIDSADGMAFQEYYLRSRQGVMISSSYERELLKLNLLAAINRRTPEGLRVEVCCGDRPGLLADISRGACPRHPAGSWLECQIPHPAGSWLECQIPHPAPPGPQRP